MLLPRLAAAGVLLLYCACFVLGSSQTTQENPARLGTQNVDLPNVTYSGYLPVSEDGKDALFYAYYEAQQDPGRADTPILLWLEVSFFSSCSERVWLCFQCCNIFAIWVILKHM